MITRVTAIEKEQKRLSDQIKMIRWFVATSKGVSKCLTSCLSALREAEFWKVFGTGLLLWLIGHMSPKLFQVLQSFMTEH